MSADAFLRAIRAAPDDDLPRLVFADYLDETGDPARAEFIRVQCELAKLPDHDPRRRAFEDREHDLLSEHEPGWIGEAAKYARDWDWRRGFVDDVTITSTDFCFHENNAAISAHPVATVSLYRLPEEREDAYMHEFFFDFAWAERPWLAELRRIDLSVNTTEVRIFEGLFRTPHLSAVRDWDLRNLPGVGELDRCFRDTPHIPRMRSLAFGGYPPSDLQSGYVPNETIVPRQFARDFEAAPLERLIASASGITTDAVRAFLSAPFAGTLKHLDISDNPIAPDAYRAFEQAHRSMRLERLDVSGTPLAGISLEPLLHSPALESLTRLEMNGCGSARRNMEVLAGSPFWAHADHLRAHSGTIPASTIEPLCGSSGPPALRLLDLADNYLRTAGVRLLCESAWAGSLTWLALSANYLDDESCRVLARSGRFAHLRTLHLAHNNIRLDRGEGEQITDAGAAELATEPSLANLRLLSLSNTGVTHRGVNAVLNGLYWRLFGLGLAGNDLSPEVVRILAGSPRLARFVWLDLADNPRLRGRVLLPLAESPYLSRLCELDCGGIDLADDVRAAFRERLGPRFSH